ncbi:MAG: oligopeptide/dipeptide ABC transporter ATP-binding protein [Acetobacteraceae bacterium]
MQPILEVNDLVKHFPIEGSRAVVQAVNGVSFTIAPGETVALVGESGSGKTTIGRCVLGLVPPTEGRIHFRNHEMGRGWNVRSPQLRGKMQLVFQEPGESLDPRMPIGRSIGEPLRLSGLGRAARQRRVEEAVERINLSRDILEQYPTELSAGQQQRVAIARAIVTEPELLVLDEPTSALDPSARAEIIELLMRLQRELGTAYLFISHDLSAVHQVSHRIIVLYLGRILEQGAARAVFRTPRHPYSVGLLSAVLLPSPGVRRKATFVLEGEIPSPINLPPGCPLVSRCPFRIARCSQEFPAAEQIAPDHEVHCFRHEEVAAREHAADTFEEFQETARKVLAVDEVMAEVRLAAGRAPRQGAQPDRVQDDPAR